MNEASVTAELIHWLKPRVPGVYLKLSDKASIGMPDLDVTALNRNTKLELKLIKLRKLSVKQLALNTDDVETDPVQLATMRLLERHGHNAWYVVFVVFRRTWWHVILTPTQVASHLLVQLCNGKGFDSIRSLLEGR